jgi:formylglycine-generating enzyme required for sulfatase activity
MRRGLSQAIWPDQPELDPGQIAALSANDTRESHLAGLSLVITTLDEKLFGTAAKVPLAIVLRRLRKLLEADTAGTLRFKVSDLFRPLFWPDASERRNKGPVIFNLGVAWEVLPVVGVTLYDAAAYAAWMRMTTQQPVVLPSEAEYEKAFSWVLEGGDNLVPERKHIFPWQGRNTLDFNQWFSRDGHSLQAIEARAAAYQKLLDDTARPVGAGKLYQGLGFGWQWTRERFNDHERKYNRFDSAGCMKRELHGRTVYEYSNVGDQNLSFFAVRGAPDQLGGPGTVTRRFALFPLRGYSECGFRCVVSLAGELC